MEKQKKSKNPTPAGLPASQAGLRAGGGRRAAGGRRVVVPTPPPLVSTPTHPRLLSRAAGDHYVTSYGSLMRHFECCFCTIFVPSSYQGRARGPGPKGVLAGPGTPRDPKSHLFVTNWVAIQPFCTSEAGFDAEFRCGSRQIGPTPQTQLFLDHFWTTNCQNRHFRRKKTPCEASGSP